MRPLAESLTPRVLIPKRVFLMTNIREESASDHDAVRRLTTDAFTDSEFGHNGEADLVEALRDTCGHSLSLVACEEGVIVGHILLTRVVIRGPEGETKGMGLGPMSVAVERQNQGIGSSLVKTALQRSSETGWPFVVVLGHPGSYPRFGFHLASEHNVSHGFDGIPQDVFFYKPLASEPDRAPVQGKAYYRSEFGSQHTTPS